MLQLPNREEPARFSRAECQTEPGFYAGRLTEDESPHGWIRKRTQMLYQSFKDEFIAPLPIKGGRLLLEDIRSWLETISPLEHTSFPNHN